MREYYYKRKMLKIAIFSCQNFAMMRKILMITQAKLGALAGITADGIAKIEREDVVPTIESMYKFCNIFGITLSDFFVPNSINFTNERNPYRRAIYSYLYGRSPKEIRDVVKVIKLIKENDAK